MPRLTTASREKTPPRTGTRGPAPKPADQRKVKTSMSIHPRILAWVDANVGVGGLASDRSSFFEDAAFQVMVRELGDEAARKEIEFD